MHAAGAVGVPPDLDTQIIMMYNRSMSEEKFFIWLKSRGVGEKDCKILSGKFESRRLIIYMATSLVHAMVLFPQIMVLHLLGLLILMQKILIPLDSLKLAKN